MSQSEEESSGIDSPVIKTRTIPQNEASSEEYDSEQDENASDEHEPEPKIVEKAIVQPKAMPSNTEPTMLAPKRALAPPITQSTIVKPKTYDTMVMDAMNALDENKRTGVSIRSVLKYVQDNILVHENFKQFFFKKALDKALKAEIFVHTSGTGMSGSIAFSTAYRKAIKLKQDKQAKALKAAEKKPAAKAKPKEKAKPKATKIAPKPKEPRKDKNNNSTDKPPAASKKPAAKPRKLRLSLPVMPAVKAKPKAKPKPKSDAPKPKTTKATAKTVSSGEAAEASTKGRKATAAPSETAVTRNRAGNSKK